MSNFYKDVICKSPLFKSTTAVKTPDLLEPVTRAAVMAILSDAKAAGHDLRLVETYRSCERQAALFKKKATKLKDVGVHHYGLAADFGLYVNGKYIGAAAPYGFLVALCKKHGLISGIDWGKPGVKNTFVDAGHVQRCAVLDQRRLFAGSFYPDDGYMKQPTMVAAKAPAKAATKTA